MPTRRQRRGGFSLNPMNWLSGEKKEELPRYTPQYDPTMNANPINPNPINPNPVGAIGGRRSRRRSRRSRIRKRR